MQQRAIGIIGLGYVGMPLASLFLEKNFIVNGIDIDQKKIDSLLQRKSYLSDFSNEKMQNLFAKNTFFVSQDFENIRNVDVIILCVPTPLDHKGTPDLSYLVSALNEISKYLKKGQLIILESSTYPGTTEELICPLIKSKGLEVGRDIHVAFSPERINPGTDKYQLYEIPKVVGGVTPKCTELTLNLYQQIFKEVVCVSSPKVAEMTKILENSQRLINISFMNEITMLCDLMEINIWEVIEAASTKPFGFMPYYPGPGIGGHCIPVDPLYLVWKAKDFHFDIPFINHAHQINQYMPLFVVKKVEKHLLKPLNECQILVIGVTYKKNVNDIRESSALQIIKHLLESGANVQYHDPYINEIPISKQTMKSIELTKNSLPKYDCVLILTDHSNLPYEMIVKESKLIIDTRNATKNVSHSGNIVLL